MLIFEVHGMTYGIACSKNGVQGKGIWSYTGNAGVSACLLCLGPLYSTIS